MRRIDTIEWSKKSNERIWMSWFIRWNDLLFVRLNCFIFWFGTESNWLRSLIYVHRSEFIFCLGTSFARIHFILNGNTFTSFLFDKKIFGFPRLQSIFIHENGTIIVDHVSEMRERECVLINSKDRMPRVMPLKTQITFLLEFDYSRVQFAIFS